MAMTMIRLLGADEYSKLLNVPESDRGALKPENSIVAIAENGSGLVGSLAAVSLPHIECAWIAPHYRGGTLFWRMERLLLDELKRRGAALALAFAVNAIMEDYCQRFGYRKLGTVWMKEI